MTLSTQEQHDSVFYLGYPAKILIPTSTHFQKTLSDRFLNLIPEAEARVRKLLRLIKKVDDQLEEALCRMTTNKVEDITINQNEKNQLRMERKKYIKELSHTLDIPIITASSSQASVIV